jgi:rare lipoprotein A (peptidoglycan hydrolase)
MPARGGVVRAQSLIVLAVVLCAAVTTRLVSSTDAVTQRARATNAVTVLAEPASDQLTGVATFYADDYHGLTMANGHTFDMHDAGITAANDWPLGTRLIVRRAPGSPWDGSLTEEERRRYFAREVEVTVQDRGAFTHELDLSLGAFRLLGRPDEGVIRVEIVPAGSQ